MCNKIKRPSPPSHDKILRAWFNDIDSENIVGWECFDNIAECINNYWNCWSCGLPKQKSKLEKCHIIPFSLGGSNDPLNFFLMCSKCHEDSPDTRHRKIFIKWVRNRKSYTEDMLDQITKVFQNYHITDDLMGEEVLNKFTDEMQNVGSHGGVLTRSTGLGVLDFVCESVMYKSYDFNGKNDLCKEKPV